MAKYSNFYSLILTYSYYSHSNDPRNSPFELLSQIVGGRVQRWLLSLSLKDTADNIFLP